MHQFKHFPGKSWWNSVGGDAPLCWRLDTRSDCSRDVVRVL